MFPLRQAFYLLGALGVLGGPLLFAPPLFAAVAQEDYARQANVAPPEGGAFIDADSTPLVDVVHGEVVVSGQATGVYGLSLADGAEPRANGSKICASSRSVRPGPVSATSTVAISRA